MNDVDFPVAARARRDRRGRRRGACPVKVNAVVKRGLNEHAILDMARHFRGTGHTLRFIEYMDVGTTNGWRLDDVVPAAEIVERISAEFPLEPVDPGYRGEVAKRWRYRDGARRDRPDRLGHPAVLRRLHTLPASRPRAGSTPASSASAATTCARCVRGGASDDELRDAVAGDLGQAHRPLLGAAHRGDRPPAEGRDELHRWLGTHCGRSLDQPGHTVAGSSRVAEANGGGGASAM